MKIISFGKTTPALLAGRKTVTRREWNPKHAASFHAGELVQAWNQSPRVKGSRRVGTIRLTEAPYLEQSDKIPLTDYELEGFNYLDEKGLRLGDGMEAGVLWRHWYRFPEMLWVVRFELVEVFP